MNTLFELKLFLESEFTGIDLEEIIESQLPGYAVKNLSKEYSLKIIPGFIPRHFYYPNEPDGPAYTVVDWQSYFGNYEGRFIRCANFDDIRNAVKWALEKSHADRLFKKARFEQIKLF